MRLERILPERWHGLTLERIVPERWRGLTLEQILPKRWHGLTKELAKFGTIGVINLVVNFAVFNLLWLTVLRSGEVKAKAIATIVATTCAYFMNRHWTYRDRPKSTIRREYSLFFFFNAVGLLIEVTVVGAAKYGFGLTHIVVLNLCQCAGHRPRHDLPVLGLPHARLPPGRPGPGHRIRRSRRRRVADAGAGGPDPDHRGHGG